MRLGELCCCWNASLNANNLEGALLPPGSSDREFDEEIAPFSSTLSCKEYKDSKVIRHYGCTGGKVDEFHFFSLSYKKVSNKPEDVEEFVFSNNDILESVTIGSKVKMEYVKSTREIKIINLQDELFYRNHRIDLPWIQEWHVGLKPFIESSEQSILFVTVHPKTFALHEIIAKKVSRARVEISPNILFGQSFWKGVAEYGDNRILKTYIAKEIGKEPVEMQRGNE